MDKCFVGYKSGAPIVIFEHVINYKESVDSNNQTHIIFEDRNGQYHFVGTVKNGFRELNLKCPAFDSYGLKLSSDINWRKFRETKNMSSNSLEDNFDDFLSEFFGIPKKKNKRNKNNGFNLGGNINGIHGGTDWYGSPCGSGMSCGGGYHRSYGCGYGGCGGGSSFGGGCGGGGC